MIAPVQKIHAWLWRRGFDIPFIRHMMLWQIVFALLALTVGLLCVTWTMWPFFFATGIIIFLNIFWGIARHTMSLALEAYSMGLFVGFLLRMGLRMALSAVALYLLIVICKAPPIALVAGVTASMAVALGVFAKSTFVERKRKN